VLIIGGALPASGQTSGGGLFQTGQIIGGGTREVRDVQPVPGFLPNASLLQPGGAGQVALVYRNPTANFRRYNKVLLDSSSPAPHPVGMPIQPAQGGAMLHAPGSRGQADVGRSGDRENRFRRKP
jgi:hypothetical protein